MSPPPAPAGPTSPGPPPPAEPGGLRVDVSADRRSRWIWVVFLAGPVVWLSHFMLVYLVVEAGCTGAGPGLEVFAPPVAGAVTVVATVAGAAACAACALWARRWWRAADPAPEGAGTPAGAALDEHVRSMAFAGYLLSALSALAVVSVGVPALFLPGC